MVPNFRVSRDNFIADIINVPFASEMKHSCQIVRISC